MIVHKWQMAQVFANRKYKFAFLAMVAFIGMFNADACTGVYVGKKVSSDGSTILARTVDSRPIVTWHLIDVVEHVAGKTNVVYRGKNGFSRVWPSERYKYVCTPRASCFDKGRFVSMAMNEKGVALTCCVSAWPKRELIKADPYVETGIAETSITEYLIAYCSSARQIVTELGKIAAEHGIAEGNIIMAADQREAWYIETYTGHHWAAVRMPEDAVAAYGNEFMLGEIARPDDADAFLGSAGLWAFPGQHGVAVNGKGGTMHLADSYSSPIVDFNHLRTWSGLCWFAPDKKRPYDRSGRFGLFFKPAKKVAATDVFAFLRNRYEGTEWCPETNDRHDIRVVGAEHQVTTHLLSVRSDLPPEMAVTGWVCLGPSEHSVYVPVSNAAESVDPRWSQDAFQGESQGVRHGQAAGPVFRRLNTLAHLDRIRLGAGVRDRWQKMEARMVAEWSSVQAVAAAAPEMSGRILTDYGRSVQRDAYESALAMIEGILGYLDFNAEVVDFGITKDGYGIEPLPPRKPYEPVSKK